MTRVPFSFTRARLIGQNTLLEASRQKLFSFLLLLALSLVAGAQWFRDFNFGAPELKFLADLGFGAMAFFGAALTVAATAQLFFSEIENRTALTLLAKPVWRAEFILGKYPGIAAVAAVFCAIRVCSCAVTKFRFATTRNHVAVRPGLVASGRHRRHGDGRPTVHVQRGGGGGQSRHSHLDRPRG